MANMMNNVVSGSQRWIPDGKNVNNTVALFLICATGLYALDLFVKNDYDLDCNVNAEGFEIHLRDAKR